ncbi:MAG: SDR family NAD(P)-dependent oxidoreductase [Granulosicoccus sp.]|nr:SDR family NAD(P)-dependent oxidoreductase [Granulosicoccus sp.]
MTFKTIAVLGAGGGIGAALVEQLTLRPDVQLIHASRHAEPTVLAAGNGTDERADAAPIRWSVLEASDEAAVRNWVESLPAIDWMINCIGMLHDQAHGPEKSIRQLDPDHFISSMTINCLPTLLLGKYALPVLRKSPAGVFATVSARVGSISDNHLGGWYSYRASKAALNMSLKCLAIEWARVTRNIRVAALHPGTTDTPLSRPFQGNVPHGKLFSPQKTARLLLEQIDALHDHPSGRFIAYDGEEIPW